MKCFNPMCKVSSPLFRVNPKGQPGIWACREHMRNTDSKIPADVDAIVKAIEGKGAGK